MHIVTLVKLILKAFGLYFLFNIAIGLIGLLNPIFLNQPFSFASLQSLNLLVFAIFAYLFLIKTEYIAKWITPKDNEKIEISDSQLMHSIVVIFGFVGIIWGLANFIEINFNKSMSDSGEGFSIGFNFQLGNIVLTFVGYLLLKNRVKFAKRLAQKTGY